MQHECTVYSVDEIGGVRPAWRVPPRPHAYLRKLGARIRAHRQALRWSQERLADEAGFHRTFVSAVERGQMNISVLALLKIARVLGTSPEALLKEDSN